MTGPVLATPLPRDVKTGEFGKQKPQIELMIRRTRGTTETDLRRFFLKSILLGCTSEGLREAFISDLKKKMVAAYEALARSGLVEVKDRKAYVISAMSDNYAAASDSVLKYLRTNKGQFLDLEQIYIYVSANCDAVARQPAEWRKLLVSFALAELVGSDIARQKFGDGKNQFQLKPEDGTPKPFELFFKVRETRGTTEQDATAFLLKLLACSKDGLTYEQMERAFTNDMVQKHDRIRWELKTSGVLVEIDGQYRYTEMYDRAYTIMSERIVERVNSNPSKIGVQFLEPLVKEDFYRAFDPSMREHVSDERFSDLFLVSLTLLDHAGKVRLVNEKFGDEHRLFVRKSRMPGDGVLPPLFQNED